MTAIDTPKEILVVDDEAILRMELTLELGDLGFLVHEAGSVGEALSILDARPGIAAGIFDIHLGGARTGFDLVRIVRRTRPDMSITVITGSTLVLPDDLAGEVTRASKPADCRLIARAVSAGLGLTKPA